MNNETHTFESLQQLLNDKKGVLLYFYSDRCAPCISLRPKVQEMLNEDFPKLNLVFVNAESHPDIAAHYGVFANPCILVFFEGREFQRYSKYISINQLGSDLERLYTIAFQAE